MSFLSPFRRNRLDFDHKKVVCLATRSKIWKTLPKFLDVAKNMILILFVNETSWKMNFFYLMNCANYCHLSFCCKNFQHIDNIVCSAGIKSYIIWCFCKSYFWYFLNCEKPVVGSSKTNTEGWATNPHAIFFINWDFKMKTKFWCLVQKFFYRNSFFLTSRYSRNSQSYRFF